MNIETKYWLLHDHKLFSILSNEENKALCLVPDFKTARKGEIILFTEDEQDRIYTLKKGTIKIVETDEHGNEVIKDILRAGDLFGQYTLEPDTRTEEYAVAVSERVIVCSFRIEDFEEILEKNAKLAIKYSKLVGFRLKRVTNLYYNLMFKDVRTRFRIFLRDWITTEAGNQTRNITIRNYLTHQEIATLICSTRQTVNQLFNECKEAGLIAYDRREISVPDLEKL